MQTISKSTALSLLVSLLLSDVAWTFPSYPPSASILSSPSNLCNNNAGNRRVNRLNRISSKRLDLRHHRSFRLQKAATNRTRWLRVSRSFLRRACGHIFSGYLSSRAPLSSLLFCSGYWGCRACGMCRLGGP